MQQRNGSQVHTNTEHTQHKTFLPLKTKHHLRKCGDIIV